MNRFTALVVVVLGCGVLFAQSPEKPKSVQKPAPAVRDPKAEAEAVKYVESVGGRAVQDASARGEPIISVVFAGKSVKDVDASKLTALTALRYLGLEDTQDTDAFLAQLTHLPTVKAVNLSRAKFSDAGFVHLAKLADLEEIGRAHV